MRKICSIIGISLLLSACANNLQYQAQWGTVAQVRQLVEQGQSVNPKSNTDSAPLALAIAAHNDPQVIKYLLDQGADPNVGLLAWSSSWQTALHVAVAHRQADAIKLLLAYGADTGIRNKDGQTPLQYAQADDRPAMAKLLSDFEMQKAAWNKAEKINTIEAYQRFTESYPDSLFNRAAKDKIAKLKVTENVQEVKRQAKIDAIEANLPANVLRDKYMVQLSSYLKEQNYKAALDIFPKLESLNIAKDPSLDYFYGEALLKTGNPSGAMQKLYKYINEQGTGAAHYAQALELINQAEPQL